MNNQDPMNLFYNSKAIMLLIKPNKEGNHLIVDANQAALDFYGYPYETLVKMHIGEIYLSSKEQRKQQMDKALKNVGNSFLMKHQLANKELKDVKVSASPIILNGKKRMFVIVQDISEQTKAIQESKDQQEYAQTLFNLSPDGMFLLSLEGKITEGNNASFKLLGTTKEKIIGKNLFRTNYLNDKDKARFINRIKQIKSGSHTESLTYQIQRSDGRNIFVEGKAELIKFKGDKYLLGTIRNITERKLQEQKLKESEAKFKYLADYTFEWEYWMNPDGEYIYSSPSCEKTTGYSTSAFEENPNLLVEITVPEYRDAVQKHFSEEIELEEIHKMEFQIAKQNGERVWIEHSCKPIYDNQGKYLGKRGINRNITKERKAKDELEESRDRYQKLSQLTFEGILIHKDGIIQDTNLALEKLLGYSRDELIGNKIVDIFTIEGSQEKVAKNIALAYSKPYEILIQHKNGSFIDLEIEAKDITFNGELMRVTALRDITEKKKARKRLSFLNTALHHSQEVVFTTDKEGVFNYINPEFTRLYGYSIEDVIRKETPRILKSGNTSDKEYSDFWNKLLLKKSFTSTYINKSKNGSLIDIEASFNPILDENGSIIGFLAIQHDITTRKKHELQQAVIASISSAVLQDFEYEKLLQFIQAEINKLIDAQNFYFAMYDKYSETISSHYFSDEYDYTPSIPSKGSLTGYLIKQKKPILVNKKEIRQLIESRKITKIGELAAQWLGVPLIKNKEVIGAFVIQSYTNENAYTIEDLKVLEIIASQISLALERKKNEEELRIALVKAQESDRLKSTFLATMSHELRTPLNAIIGFSDLADEEKSKEEIISFCNIINRSGNHLLGIVNEVFDFTLFDTGDIKLSYGEYPIKDILEDLFKIIQKEQITQNKENIKLSYYIPKEHKNLLIKTDNQRINQVLLNILKNAVKFTDSGSIKYGFNVLKENKAPILQFFIEDTGIGIEKGKQEIIFDVFRQANDSHTRKHDGVGLGLAISKKIISLMQGEIWLESETGKGSKFTINLPCHLSTAKSEPDNKHQQKAKPKKHIKKNILIAEDESLNYELLEFILKPLEANIIWAKNGKEALDITKSNAKIDLILMDIRMPILNGLEATKQIKTLSPNLPIIAQTAYAISGDKELALKAGCDNYISKPINKKG